MISYIKEHRQLNGACVAQFTKPVVHAQAIDGHHNKGKKFQYYSPPSCQGSYLRFLHLLLSFELIPGLRNATTNNLLYPVGWKHETHSSLIRTNFHGSEESFQIISIELQFDSILTWSRIPRRTLLFVMLRLVQNLFTYLADIRVRHRERGTRILPSKFSLDKTVLLDKVLSTLCDNRRQ